MVLSLVALAVAFATAFYIRSRSRGARGDRGGDGGEGGDSEAGDAPPTPPPTAIVDAPAADMAGGGSLAVAADGVGGGVPGDAVRGWEAGDAAAAAAAAAAATAAAAGVVRDAAGSDADTDDGMSSDAGEAAAAAAAAAVTTGSSGAGGDAIIGFVDDGATDDGAGLGGRVYSGLTDLSEPSFDYILGAGPAISRTRGRQLREDFMGGGVGDPTAVLGRDSEG